MKTLILSNWSAKIAELNTLTEPNKAAYAKLHGYEFENVCHPYDDHVQFLYLLADRLERFEVVMTIGCDAIFVNQSIKVKDRIDFAEEWGGEFKDTRAILAHNLSCCWPIQINNDVMIWPSGLPAKGLIAKLIEDASIWINYPQLWQHHLWNLIQPSGGFANHVRLVEPRQMNSTFQPMTRQVVETDEWKDGERIKKSRLTRIPGNSSYALGDWIFHALDMPLGDKIQVIKWALQYVGDGSYLPETDPIGEKIQL